MKRKRLLNDSIGGEDMLKRIIKIALPMLILGILICPALADAATQSYVLPRGYTGGVGFYGDGTVAQATAVTTEIRNAPQKPSDLQKVQELFSYVDIRWHEKSFHGQTVMISYYLSPGANDLYSGTYVLYIRNLYQPNQEILGFDHTPGFNMP